MWSYNYSPELYHYGVMGMKWGHRKALYNKDGSLTARGMRAQNEKNKMIKRAQTGIKDNKEDIKYYQGYLNDIAKKGIKSESAQHVYRTDSRVAGSLSKIDKSFKDKKTPSGYKDYENLTTKQKKMVVNEVKKRHEDYIKTNKKLIKEGEATLKKLKTSDMSYYDAVASSKRMRKAASVVGAVLAGGGYAYAQMRKGNSVSVAKTLGASYAGGIAGGAVGGMLGDKIYKQNKRLKQ